MTAANPKPAIRPVTNESGLSIQPLYTAEDLAASGWRPGEGFMAPPRDPDRNFARPA